MYRAAPTKPDDKASRTTQFRSSYPQIEIHPQAVSSAAVGSPRAVKVCLPAYSLQMTCAGKRPREAVVIADHVSGGLSNQHGTRTRGTRHSARRVDRTAEPVPRAAHRRTRRHPDAQLR